MRQTQHIPDKPEVFHVKLENAFVDFINRLVSRDLQRELNVCL